MHMHFYNVTFYKEPMHVQWSCNMNECHYIKLTSYTKNHLLVNGSEMLSYSSEKGEKAPDLRVCEKQIHH